jgi:hypothetical protein
MTTRFCFSSEAEEVPNWADNMESLRRDIEQIPVPIPKGDRVREHAGPAIIGACKPGSSPREGSPSKT